jgi:predicted RNase H-like HicB family nuclease
MSDYSIIVFYSAEDEAYVAEIPDLAGCNALGSSPEEAVRELAIAKQAWLDGAREAGTPIPEPTPRQRAGT